MKSSTSNLRPCVFFDRDGIVNASPGPGYVERWEDFRLLPDFVAALRLVRAAGFAAVIVTNQRGVARGIMSQAAVDRIHANLRVQLVAQHGLDLDAIKVCPHERGVCDCRKPQPGMLLAAARELGLDLGRSWLIGDSESDVEAAHRAGCRALRIAGGPVESRAEIVAPDWPAALARLPAVLDVAERGA